MHIVRRSAQPPPVREQISQGSGAVEEVLSAPEASKEALSVPEVAEEGVLRVSLCQGLCQGPQVRAHQLTEGCRHPGVPP